MAPCTLVITCVCLLVCPFVYSSSPQRAWSQQQPSKTTDPNRQWAPNQMDKRPFAWRRNVQLGDKNDDHMSSDDRVDDHTRRTAGGNEDNDEAGIWTVNGRSMLVVDGGKISGGESAVREDQSSEMQRGADMTRPADRGRGAAGSESGAQSSSRAWATISKEDMDNKWKTPGRRTPRAGQRRYPWDMQWTPMTKRHTPWSMPGASATGPAWYSWDGSTGDMWTNTGDIGDRMPYAMQGGRRSPGMDGRRNAEDDRMLTNPNGMRRNPEGMRRNPDWDLRTPNGMRRNPGSMRRNPDWDLRTPNSMRKNPDGDRRTPNGMRRNPDSMRRNPNGDRGTPNSMRRNPDGMRRNPDGRDYMMTGDGQGNGHMIPWTNQGGISEIPWVDSQGMPTGSDGPIIIRVDNYGQPDMNSWRDDWDTDGRRKVDTSWYPANTWGTVRYPSYYWDGSQDSLHQQWWYDYRWWNAQYPDYYYWPQENKHNMQYYPEY